MSTRVSMGTPPRAPICRDVSSSVALFSSLTRITLSCKTWFAECAGHPAGSGLLDFDVVVVPFGGS